MDRMTVWPVSSSPDEDFARERVGRGEVERDKERGTKKSKRLGRQKIARQQRERGFFRDAMCDRKASPIGARHRPPGMTRDECDRFDRVSHVPGRELESLIDNRCADDDARSRMRRRLRTGGGVAANCEPLRERQFDEPIKEPINRREESSAGDECSRRESLVRKWIGRRKHRVVSAKSTGRSCSGHEHCAKIEQPCIKIL
jgi:hypothetical protein